MFCLDDIILFKVDELVTLDICYNLFYDLIFEIEIPSFCYFFTAFYFFMYLTLDSIEE
jgi:hypothetical protein